MTQSKSTFKVFKDRDNRPRWVAVSSTAYVDRDGEIVSVEALKGAVESRATLGVTWGLCGGGTCRGLTSACVTSNL